MPSTEQPTLNRQPPPVKNMNTYMFHQRNSKSPDSPFPGWDEHVEEETSNEDRTGKVVDGDNRKMFLGVVFFLYLFLSHSGL